MALNLNDKKQIVEEVKALAENSYSVVCANYRGLTVDEMTQLRVKAREAGASVRVIKNTLAKMALEGTQFEGLEQAMVGPIVYLFAHEDPGAAARVAKDFIKEYKKLEVTGLTIGKGFIPGAQLDVVASLPTYDEAISKLMYVMKAPVEKFARTLNEVPGKLVRTVAAIKDAKEAA